MKHFINGLKDSIPIGLSYLSVSFTFGMTGVAQGMPLWVLVLISLTCLTSAGQFSGLTIILQNGSLIELALSQLIINLRYTLMSISLSQKIDPDTTTAERAVISFGITDEIFALAASKPHKVTKHYMYGLIILPLFCWTMGTFLGGVATSLMPMNVRNALNIAIYAMFIAIFVPPAKKERPILITILIAVACSYVFTWLNISAGFSTIFCTLIAAGIGAWLFPVQEVAHE